MILHPSLDSTALQAGLDRYHRSRAFWNETQASLSGAREELKAATAAQDALRASEAARRVAECELVAGDVLEPSLDGDCRSAMCRAAESFMGRFEREVTSYHRGEYLRERGLLSRSFCLWARAWPAWARSGTPPEKGLELLAEASRLASLIDEFVRTMPPAIRRPDALQRAGVRVR